MTTNGKKHSILEEVFETCLFQCRFFVLLAVLGSLVAAILMFLKGCTELVQSMQCFVPQLRDFKQTSADDKALLVSIIPAIDYYLFATVLLMFSMGIYELFISEIDPASRGKKSRPDWLNFKSLEDLKTHIGKVIVMILIVNFFEKSFSIDYKGPFDLMYLSGGIFLIGLTLIVTQNIKSHPHDNNGGIQKRITESLPGI